MIIEKFLEEVGRQCESSYVIDIREVKIPKPDHGHNLLIEFENGFILRINGFVSIEREKL